MSGEGPSPEELWSRAGPESTDTHRCVCVEVCVRARGMTDGSIQSAAWTELLTLIGLNERDVTGQVGMFLLLL